MTHRNADDADDNRAKGGIFGRCVLRVRSCVCVRTSKTMFTPTVRARTQPASNRAKLDKNCRMAAEQLVDRSMATTTGGVL